MSNITTIYKKSFSKISDIQSPEKILYNLCENHSEDLTTYGIEIVSETNGEKEKTALEHISESKDTTLDIITFLYENAVKPSSSFGIICDILSVKSL